MANPEHVAKLKEGVEAWNKWRKKNRRVEIDLRKADLSGTDLSRASLGDANLRGANLSRANLIATFLFGAKLDRADLSFAQLCAADLAQANLGYASLNEADLRGANLSAATSAEADFSRADLRDAIFTNADLREAHFRKANLNNTGFFQANLTEADFTGADLTGANLNQATLVGTNFKGANLTGCAVYGISAWDIRLEGAIQSNLVINRFGKSVLQVDNLEVAQFVYLLLNNERIRHVIDTITSHVVLILGRFTPERKAVLDAIREELRRRKYLPILFDFQKPDSKDLTGTVTTLANMARFIVADLTDPASVPHELAMIAPGTVVPVQTILLEGQREYAMFRDLKTRYHWVLEPYQYKSPDLLLAQLSEKVIAPAEAKAKELIRK